MTEILVAQRADCAALRTLRWEWRTMPPCSARPEARTLYSVLEHDLLCAIQYRATVIARMKGSIA